MEGPQPESGIERRLLAKARRLSEKKITGFRKNLARSEPGNPKGIKWIASA